MEFKFKTFEELQEKYPIGSVIVEWDENVVKHVDVYSDADLSYYKTIYSKVEPVPGIMYAYEATGKKHVEARVTGYIYDGDFWYPAYLNCDGWQAYE